ncbi:MAG: hypothetical protein ACI33P_04615 [Lysinibacillus sp.]
MEQLSVDGFVLLIEKEIGRLKANNHLGGYYYESIQDKVKREATEDSVIETK